MKNLILISLDTVRADVAYSGKFQTIESLRKQGVTFLNTISSSPFTPASHATVFTGVHPPRHHIRHLFKEQLNPKTKTVAQILKKAGYKTGAVVSCPGMNKWYGFSQGFDFYDDEIPRLADGSDPLLTVDVKKRGTALKRANVVVERAYDCLKKIQKEGYLDNTSIVAFSDHGEDLDGWYPNDKGGKKLGHPEELGHGCLLYDQTQKVVLIVKDKEFPKNKNIEQQVRLVDLLPTVTDLLNIKTSIHLLDGVSLVPIVRYKKDFQLSAYSE